MSGSIANQDDVDIYELGHLNTSDRITVNLDIAEANLDAAIAIFHTDPEKTVGILFATNDKESVPTDSRDPIINEAIRHAVPLGGGHGPINHFAGAKAVRNAEKR